MAAAEIGVPSVVGMFQPPRVYEITLCHTAAQPRVATLYACSNLPRVLATRDLMLSLVYMPYVLLYQALPLQVAIFVCFARGEKTASQLLWWAPEGFFSLEELTFLVPGMNAEKPGLVVARCCVCALKEND